MTCDSFRELKTVMYQNTQIWIVFKAFLLPISPPVFLVYFIICKNMEIVPFYLLTLFAVPTDRGSLPYCADSKSMLLGWKALIVPEIKNRKKHQLKLLS